MRSPVRHKRQPLPANAKYVYEVFITTGREWRYRHVLGYTDDEEFAKTWARQEVAQHTRITAVHIQGGWYLLSSVKPISLVATGRPSIESFDPVI